MLEFGRVNSQGETAMPYVFRFSAVLLVLAIAGGQYWQLKAAAPGSDSYAATVRASCPAMGGPRKVETMGQKVRFYDAYMICIIGGWAGFSSGCR